MALFWLPTGASPRNSFPLWSIWSDRRPICARSASGLEDDIERRQREIAAAARSVDVGNGVIIATDMFGGTPCNLALTLLERGKIEVLAGANLPSLIKLIDIRAKVPLEQAVKEAIDAGRKYMRAGSADLA